ncbi:MULTISPECIES: response regulator transcription factor [unclassified Nesterenkonia]|uniref:response regulator transcription factor n=1 Tax=unclassified Nesterenkonia TaxID=2629769 RepID=UPI000872BFE6|nr:MULTISPECIES: response regulator transcription factor [unclassified Nesterenkonia]MDS2173122.1 response regulator transcription factor [Nesterenkonia sp. CL21]OSM42043.1 DNA-binding response regulator [Nesterenkonia sp. PF2B19]
MRVIIAEDSVLLREGLVRLLTHDGIDVAAAVGDAHALLEAVAAHRPDLVIVDVRMPPTHTDEGIRAALQLRREDPALAVVVLSQYVEERYAVDLLTGETRGVAYLLKDRVADVDEFLRTVHTVADGGTILDPEVVSQLLTRRAGRDGIDLLTRREREVLGLMAEGRSNAGIAATLHLSDSAVSKHINAIFSTLDIPPASTDNRRVLAVLTYLSSGAESGPS